MVLYDRVASTCEHITDLSISESWFSISEDVLLVPGFNALQIYFKVIVLGGSVLMRASTPFCSTRTLVDVLALTLEKHLLTCLWELPMIDNHPRQNLGIAWLECILRAIEEYLE